MFGKSKKTVSVAYKEKLLAEIAHFDKRIEEALNKRKPNTFEDESFEDDVRNPYKFKLQSSQYELKQQEASLSDRASMTLELAMLTIMQSEVNIMVTPPEVRKPVLEDGVWHEVAAECKIDLVSFTITFYAHTPHRRFAPTRYRNLAVALVKLAHQKELAQSILPKLQLPNLALQVLQSYAAAFRSRRTSLLELAERYTDKLKMQAVPDGGYRVRFLDLLQVDWTLENLWSPIVPFCHRMKFEVEYMPKDYISAIGKLYKQFKDPSLETSERTATLSKIFDICLQAAAPARELMESFESDPETAGRHHERRTTIDQEPDVPHVEHSPKKPSGKENKPQNRKTDMAPPKTIPKKAKKSKPNEKIVSESRKSVKRAVDSDNSNAKRSRNDEGDVDVSKSKAGLKGGSSVKDKDEMADGLKANAKKTDKPENTEKVVLEGNGHKMVSSKLTAKTSKESVKATVDPENDAMRKGDGKINKAKGASKTQVIGNKKNGEGSSKDSSKASSTVSKKNSDNNIEPKDTNTEITTEKTKIVIEKSGKKNDKTLSKNIGNQKEKNVTEKYIVSVNKDAENKEITQNNKLTTKNTVKSKDKNKENDTVSSKNTETTTTSKIDSKKGSSKKNDVNVDSKRGTNSGGDENGTSKQKDATTDVGISKRNTYTKVTKGNADNDKPITDTETVRAGSKTVSNDFGKDKAVSKTAKETNGKVIKTVAKHVEKNAVDKIDVKKSKDIATKTILNKDGKNVNSGDMKETDDKNTKGPSKVVDKNKVANKKQTENAKPDLDKEKTQEKRKVSPKTTDQKVQDKTFTKSVTNEEISDKNDEVFAKKRKTTETIKNNNVPVKKTATEKPKTNSKPTNNTRILKETNQDNTRKAEKKMNHTNKTIQKNNLLNVTITKPKIMPISKIPAEKQIKIADKLKTKIPMMKNKMTFASLSSKLGGNVGKISEVEKTRIPQKSLPVFKRLTKNLPTRMSPRKLPTFKPYAQGYSKK